MQIHNKSENINLNIFENAKVKSSEAEISSETLVNKDIFNETKIGSLSASTILELFERSGFTKEEPSYYEEAETEELEREIEILKNRLKNSAVSLNEAINIMLANGIPVTSINISALNTELNKIPPPNSEEFDKLAEKDLSLFNEIKHLTESEKINAINLEENLTFESVYKAKHTAFNSEKLESFEGLEEQLLKLPIPNKEVAKLFYENSVPFDEENFIKYEQLTNLADVDDESVLEFSNYKSYSGKKTIEIPHLLEYDALKKKLDMVGEWVKLTAEAAMNLSTLDINNKPAQELLLHLKELEQGFLINGANVENSVASETIKALKVIENPLPQVFKSIVLEKNLFNIETVANEQIRAKAALGYKPLETVPNAKFGDSFAKVHDQLKGVLEQNNILVNEENIKIASIMSRTGIDITQDSFLEVSLASKKIGYINSHLHPSIAMELLNNGEDVLKMPIDTLIEKIEARSASVVENLSSHIANISNKISTEERENLMSLYKALHRIDAFGGASIGVNIKSMHSLTLEHLLNSADNFSGHSSSKVKQILNEAKTSSDKILENIKTLQTDAALILEKSSMPVLNNIEVMQSLTKNPLLVSELLDEKEFYEIKDSIPSSVLDYLDEDIHNKIAISSAENLDFLKALHFSKVIKVSSKINSSSYSLPINFKGRITALHMFISSTAAQKPSVAISIDGNEALINTETMDISIKGLPLNEELLREIFAEKGFVLNNILDEENITFGQPKHESVKEVTKQMMFNMASCFTKYINKL